MKIDFTVNEVYYIVKACDIVRRDANTLARLYECGNLGKEDVERLKQKTKMYSNILKKLGNAAREQYE